MIQIQDRHILRMSQEYDQADSILACIRRNYGSVGFSKGIFEYQNKRYRMNDILRQSRSTPNIRIESIECESPASELSPELLTLVLSVFCVYC